MKKVNKTESKLARIGKNEEKQSLAAFRGQLKSTGQNKFALEEKEEVHVRKYFSVKPFYTIREEKLTGENI